MLTPDKARNLRPEDSTLVSLAEEKIDANLSTHFLPDQREIRVSFELATTMNPKASTYLVNKYQKGGWDVQLELEDSRRADAVVYTIKLVEKGE